MNREIKFRVWDKHKGEMYDPMPIIDFTLIRINAKILMQFTGLYDKNGEEIYEGDILSIRMLTKQNGSFTIKAVIDFHGAAFWFTGDGYTDCNWHFYNAIDRIVIGNVFEHPSLLKTESTNK